MTQENCFKVVVDDLKERLYKLRTFDSTEQIGIYCDDLECEVILTVESAIKHMMKVQEDLLKEIREYRSRLIDSRNPKLDESEEELVETEFVLELIKHDLLGLEKDVEEFANSSEVKKEAIEEADGLKARIKALSKRQREQAFKGEFLHFKPNHLLSLTHQSIGVFEQRHYEPNKEPKQLDRDSALTIATGHTEMIRKMIFLSSDLMASCSLDQTIKIWNLETGELLSTLQETSAIFSLACLPDGHLACGLEDGRINIWDWETGSLKKTFRTMPEDLFDFFEQVEPQIRLLRFLKSGNLVSASSMGLEVWSLFSRENPEPIHTTDEETQDLCSFLDELSNGYLITATDSRFFSKIASKEHVVLTVWTRDLEKKVDTFELSNGLVNTFLVLSNDLVVVGDYDSVRIFDLIAKSLSMTLIRRASSGNRALAELANGYLAAAFNPFDPTESHKHSFIHIYNTTNGQLVQSVEFEPEQCIVTMISSSESKTLVVGFEDTSVEVFSLDFEP